MESSLERHLKILSMSFEILTTPDFDREVKALAKKYRSLPNDLKSLSQSLSENPFQGDEIAPGIRKIRMAIAAKGRGKSGGARVISYTVVVTEAAGEIYLLDIYDKSQFSTVDVRVIQAKLDELNI